MLFLCMYGNWEYYTKNKFWYLVVQVEVNLLVDRSVINDFPTDRKWESILHYIFRIFGFESGEKKCPAGLKFSETLTGTYIYP